MYVMILHALLCNTCKMSYIGQTSRDLNPRYQEHIRYIRNNDPQSAYAQHILQNLHEYGSIADTMSLFKPIYKTSTLISYKQLFIQTFHHNGNLIKEQGTGEQNPLFQLTIDTMVTSETTLKKQINTSPTHSNQLQLFRDSTRQQYGYAHRSSFYTSYCIFRRIHIINNNFSLIYRYYLTVKFYLYLLQCNGYQMLYLQVFCDPEDR
jgi:hypothetical protein